MPVAAVVAVRATAMKNIINKLWNCGTRAAKTANPEIRIFGVIIYNLYAHSKK
jgi:hypothetical protein